LRKRRGKEGSRERVKEGGKSRWGKLRKKTRKPRKKRKQKRKSKSKGG
jgi:hypothetical protein